MEAFLYFRKNRPPTSGFLRKLPILFTANQTGEGTSFLVWVGGSGFFRPKKKCPTTGRALKGKKEYCYFKISSIGV